MAWQDLVIAMCQFGFILAFIPTLRGKDKPAVITSSVNAVLVLVITFCLATLSLWLAMATAFVLALQWIVVAVQKVKIDRQVLENVSGQTSQQ